MFVLFGVVKTSVFLLTMQSYGLFQNRENISMYFIQKSEFC